MSDRDWITQDELTRLFPHGLPIAAVKLLFPEKSEPLNTAEIYAFLVALSGPATLSDHPTVKALVATERDAWREEPESSEAWCAGNQHVLDRLCVVVGADPAAVQWDGSDGSLQEETDALIWRILRHNDDDDGLSPRERALVAEAVAAERERCIKIAVWHWEGEPEDTIAMAAEMRVGMAPLSDYEKKVAQMKEGFPNGI